MQAIVETLFDTVYLFSVITIGILMIRKSKGNRQFTMFGIMAFPGIPQPVKLGLAGGPLIVSILISRFGPKYKLITYTTMSANLLPVSYTHLDVYKRQIISSDAVYGCSQSLYLSAYIAIRQASILSFLPRGIP